uniref:SEN1 n=1 Tax=Solanum tuberosum TaxID=4113 RepID=M1BQP3_SOLTU
MGHGGSNNVLCLKFGQKMDEYHPYITLYLRWLHESQEDTNMIEEEVSLESWEG